MKSIRIEKGGLPRKGTNKIKARWRDALRDTELPEANAEARRTQSEKSINPMPFFSAIFAASATLRYFEG